MAAIVREPIGVVAMVTPWNFPALILAQKLPYALAAGCTVVLKPSEFTSATTLMICGLLVEAGLPKGVVNCITGYGNPAGQRMLDHPDVDMISFTGSTRIGRTAIESSALGVKKVSLELGGNNAQIIFADADLTIAADACVEGAFKNAGESCNCGGRIFVERSILPQFLDQFLAFARKVRVGDPLDPKSMVGAMIHKEHKAKVQSALQDALAAGAKVLLGGIGDVPSNNGHYMDLTVLTDVAPDSAIAQAEIFGPIVTIHPFDTENEAIDAANATAYGLSAAAWTTNYQRAMRCGRRLKAGTVWINTFLSGPAELPFGGVKDSGIGRENGVAGIEEFTEMKTIQFHSGARSDLWSDGWK
jgi:acyl-CoA reductase-like NAD-dependent aldehyde dehydrogenase